LPWWRYDYDRLRNYLSKFVDFPIKTSLEKGQPRLLLTSVDIQDYTTPVVFDSYEKLHDAPVRRSNTASMAAITTYRDILSGKPRISKVWRIDRLESADATFGKITDFTPSTIRKLIQSGEIDARISIDRMEVIFAIEDLISDGIMSIEEGDEIMKEAREVITTEQLLYRKSKEEVIEAYNKFVKRIESKNMPPDRKEILISPGRDIIALLSEAENLKLANK
jgi:hypothetical protein